MFYSKLQIYNKSKQHINYIYSLNRHRKLDNFKIHFFFYVMKISKLIHFVITTTYNLFLMYFKIIVKLQN